MVHEFWPVLAPLSDNDNSCHDNDSYHNNGGSNNNNRNVGDEKYQNDNNSNDVNDCGNDNMPLCLNFYKKKTKSKQFRQTH